MLRELADIAEQCVEVVWIHGKMEEERLVKRIVESNMR